MVLAPKSRLSSLYATCNLFLAMSAIFLLTLLSTYAFADTTPSGTPPSTGFDAMAVNNLTSGLSLLVGLATLSAVLIRGGRIVEKLDRVSLDVSKLETEFDGHVKESEARHAGTEHRVTVVETRLDPTL